MSSDRFLEYLVQQVEETGIGFSVTLCIRGLVVYGNMIRSKIYYDLVSEIFNKSNLTSSTQDPNEIKMADDYFESYQEFVKDMRKFSQVDSFNYIHLEHARIISPGFEPIITGAWRGKISSVDAFSLGHEEIKKES